jgi:VWFA-related protein
MPISPRIVPWPRPRGPSALCAALLAGFLTFAPSVLKGQEEVAEGVSTRDVEPTFTLQVERNLVLVRVVVRDAEGTPVETLRKEDFQLFDRSKPQTISHFSLEKPALKAAAKPTETQPEAAGKARDEVSPSPPSAPKRFLALYFDDVHTTFEDMGRARDAADHYLASATQPGDRVGVFTTSGQKQLDFTADLGQVHQALFELRPRPITPKGRKVCVDIPPYEAYLIFELRDVDALALATNEACVNCYTRNSFSVPLKEAEEEAQSEATLVYNQMNVESRAALRGIEGLIRRMTILPGGQRSVVIVSAGFLTESLQYELGELVDRALRANVILNSLDARGLYTDPGIQDASQRGTATPGCAGKIQTDGGPPIPVGAPPGSKIHMLQTSAMIEASAMQSLAAETGGVFFHNINDLEAGFRQAAALPDPYYVLAFSPQNLKLDGSFHALQVKLVSEPRLTVQARRGYFAPKQVADPSVRVKEDIREALFSQDESRELPVDVHTQFFVKSNADVQLTVLAHVDLHPLHFRKQEERNVNDLTFVTALFDRDGHMVTVREKTVQLRLLDATLTGLRGRGLTLRAQFDIKPGTYLVRTVVRDSESGQISGLNRTVEIPY